MNYETARAAKQALREELGFFTDHCLIPEMFGIGLSSIGGYHIRIYISADISAEVRRRYGSYRGVRVEFEISDPPMVQ